MVDIQDFQAAVINFLRTEPSLTGTYPSANVGEYSFQTQTLAVPAIRLKMRPETPIGNGTDHLNFSNYQFSIVVFSEKDSSREAATIMSAINAVLHNWQIKNNNLHINRIGIIRVVPPLRIDRRLWMAETFFNSFASIVTT